VPIWPYQFFNALQSDRRSDPNTVQKIAVGEFASPPADQSATCLTASWFVGELSSKSTDTVVFPKGRKLFIIPDDHAAPSFKREQFPVVSFSEISHAVNSTPYQSEVPLDIKVVHFASAHSQTAFDHISNVHSKILLLHLNTHTPKHDAVE